MWNKHVLTTPFALDSSIHSYTDIDSYIPNRLIDARILLPQSDEIASRIHLPIHPYLLVTTDHNGFNAGSFFIRVCLEALDFLDAVLAYDKTYYTSTSTTTQSEQLKKITDIPPLPFEEQSAMRIVMEERKMREHGQVAFLPQHLFNSYIGEEAITHAGDANQDLAIFNLHFPNWGRKRLVMLPMLSRLRNGEITLHQDRALQAKKAVEDAARQYWATWTPGS